MCRGDTKSPALALGFFVDVAHSFLGYSLVAHLAQLRMGNQMRRQETHIKHVLDLVQAEADVIGITTERLVQRFLDTDGGHQVTQQEVRYAIALATEAGYLAPVELTPMVEAGVQLTWAGHDYLDAANARINTRT